MDEAGDLPLMEELTLWEVAAGLGGAAVVRDWRPLLPALRTPLSPGKEREENVLHAKNQALSH